MSWSKVAEGCLNLGNAWIARSLLSELDRHRFIPEFNELGLECLDSGKEEVVAAHELFVKTMARLATLGLKGQHEIGAKIGDVWGGDKKKNSKANSLGLVGLSFSQVAAVDSQAGNSVGFPFWGESAEFDSEIGAWIFKNKPTKLQKFGIRKTPEICVSRPVGSSPPHRRTGAFLQKEHCCSVPRVQEEPPGGATAAQLAAGRDVRVAFARVAVLFVTVRGGVLQVSLARCPEVPPNVSQFVPRSPPSLPTIPEPRV